MYGFLVLIILFLQLAEVASANEAFEAQGPYRAKLKHGFILLIIGNGIWFFASRISWDAAFDFQWLATLYLGTPMILMSLCHLAGHFFGWQINTKKQISRLETFLVLNLFVSTVVIFANS